MSATMETIRLEADAVVLVVLVEGQQFLPRVAELPVGGDESHQRPQVETADDNEIAAHQEEQKGPV